MKKFLKYLASLFFCNTYRLLKIFPNNDPIMGFAMPFARRDKWWQALLFPIIAMVSFDFITMKVGVWTIGTAATYGLIGLLFYAYFKGKKKAGLATYAKGSAAGILIFDFFTGPVMSSWLFKVPFYVAFLGQIPFTAMHLASGVTLAMLIVPVMDPAVRPEVHALATSCLQPIKAIVSRLFLRV